MKGPHCIAISGIDGSGKTTLANWLVVYLRNRGYKSRYVWIKSKHTFAYVLSLVLTAFGWRQTLRNPNGVAVTRFTLPESILVKKIWPFIEFVSVLPLVIFKVKIPLRLGYRIILDRYTIDTITSISIGTKNKEFADSFLGKILLRLMPKEYALILLDVDIKTILKRRSDVEYSYEEIAEAINLYKKLSEKIGGISFRTDELSVSQAKNKILEVLFVEKKIPITKMSHKKLLDFSIAIPTINRVDKLKNLLESILCQQAMPREVYVIDQSNNKLTFELVGEMEQKFADKKVNLKYLHIKEKSSSKARNVGIENSTGEIVFFVDDDVVLPKEYTKSILKIYESHTDALGAQGLILDPLSEINPNSLFDNLENSLKRTFFLSNYRKNTWKIMPSVNDVFPYPLTAVISIPRMQGCCSYRRDILDLYKYDENLRGWAFLEDMDISYRIFQSYLGSLYATPDARILHEEHAHMSGSIKEEAYKKIVNRVYVFFKLIEKSPRTYLIFCWSIFGLLLTTTIGTIGGRRKHRNKWLSIYLIKASFYALRHLREIKQLDLKFLSRV